MFPKSSALSTVRTVTRFRASPEQVWATMMFYEEIPGRPNPLLRLILPLPVSTQGEKTRVGALIHCTYEGGSLEKKITAVDPARALRFEVCKQALGIEDCIETTDGSYELRADGDDTELALTTRYHGRLRPRWLFEPVEKLVGHGLHRHILRGMRVALETAAKADVKPAFAKV
ncbi:MAG: hypothetical protein ABI551_17995 [Polyangiaceae bacterium]